MKSSSDSANDSIAAATMPGRISGRVTRRNVRSGGAPRSIAASSSVQSIPRRRARTVRATKATSKLTWASTIVPNPRFQPRSMNIVSSEAPITTSGAVSDSTRNASTVPWPRNRRRTSASAASVPSTRAMAVETAATWRLVTSASVSWGYLNGSAQLANVNPFHVRLNFPRGSLNEKRTMMTMGANR